MQRVRRVPLTETVQIPGNNLSTLLETLRTVFRSRWKVERFQYMRGSPLIVERMVPEDQVPPARENSEFITPFQHIRTQSDLSIAPVGAGGLLAISQAIQSLTRDRKSLTMFVTGSKHDLDEWAGIRVSEVWQVPVHEDHEVPGNGVFVCGAEGPSSLISDIDTAIFCGFEE